MRTATVLSIDRCVSTHKLERAKACVRCDLELIDWEVARAAH